VRIWDAAPWDREAPTEREAQGLLEFLLSKPLPKPDVIAYVNQSPTINPHVRRKALSLVDHYREETNADAFQKACWAAVRSPYLNPFQYRFALAQAEAACQLAPARLEHQTTLGMAQYRLGHFQDALATLERADAVNKGMPSNLAFLAMARFRLRQEKLASTTLTHLRQTIKEPRWAASEEARGFLAEAEAFVEGMTH